MAFTEEQSEAIHRKGANILLKSKVKQFIEKVQIF